MDITSLVVYRPMSDEEEDTCHHGHPSLEYRPITSLDYLPINCLD
jgi:hypothetical protein